MEIGGDRERDRGERERGGDAEAALELWDLDQSGFEVITLSSYIQPFVIVLKQMGAEQNTCRCFAARASTFSLEHR